MWFSLTVTAVELRMDQTKLEEFRTTDSLKEVKTTLSVSNKLLKSVSVSHSPCMPSITTHHAPLCVYVCVSHHIFRNPIIQRSSEQPSPTALLTTAKCQQATSSGINKRWSDLMTSLDLLTPARLSRLLPVLRESVPRRGKAWAFNFRLHYVGSPPSNSHASGEKPSYQNLSKCSK